MSAYFDALGTALSGLLDALPTVAMILLTLLAVMGWLALLLGVGCVVEGDGFHWSGWLFGVLAGPINSLFALAPVFVILVKGAGA